MLVDNMRTALTNARKDRDTMLIRVHTSVLAKIMVAEKSGNYQLPLSDEVVQSLIQKEIKELEETASFLAEGNLQREMLLSQANYLHLYLPQPYTENEVKEIITNYIITSGATHAGKITGAIAKMVGSRFDKSLIKGLVEQMLGE